MRLSCGSSSDIFDGFRTCMSWSRNGRNFQLSPASCRITFLKVMW